jgi:hypothetical protein
LRKTALPERLETAYEIIKFWTAGRKYNDHLMGNKKRE